MLDRFAYGTNLARATGYHEWSSAFWPPARDYRLYCLDLAKEVPALGPGFTAELETLRAAIDAEWRRSGSGGGKRMRDATAIALCLNRIAAMLPNKADRTALGLRADAVERGYDDDALAALRDIDEQITVVAGRISTWYGKQTGGLPTAFGAVRDDAAQAPAAAAHARTHDVLALLQDIHKALRLGEIPQFTTTRLFFMAGEGNRHPKHIAYFLPEDEGVKRSPFKKTVYFMNTHRELINAISLPLSRTLLDLGRASLASAAEYGPLPTLGVLAHEIGHFVHRQGATFAALNDADRWASISLQETAADVFGTLILAQALGCDAATVVAYHLGECLRYVDRGLGNFPDSDGMYLQLNYLASFGALDVDPATGQLSGDPDVIVAGFRSMARVLADTLLNGDVDRTLAFYRTYGPAICDRLQPLVDALSREPQKTIEYLQESRVPMISIRREMHAMPVRAKNDALHTLYCTPVNGSSLTRYEIWERGEACGDSVTPSTYCPEYRTHMILKILSLARTDDRVFSIGCGNAFVEAGLLARGLHVQAIDCNQEAVDLAAAKGVDAFTAFYGDLPEGHFAEFGTIYADGLLGHLYRAERGLDEFFEKLRALKPPPGSWLVLSNDAPKNGAAVTPHGAVNDFWLFSPDYLRETVSSFGYSVAECYAFPYERPVSGLRNRTICIARVGEGATG